MAARHHHARGRAVGVEHPVAVDREHPAPLVVANVGGAQRVAAHARGTHRDVERAQVGLDARDRPLNLLGPTHIAGDREHPLELGRPEVQRRDTAPRGEYAARHGGADVSGPAGDQRRAPREVIADGHRGGSVVSLTKRREESEMARPVTLFTGQWADLSLEELAAKAAGWGFDGLELACWGDHFEVDRALAESDYVQEKRALLERHGLGCWAIGAHLVGQAVCDPIDEPPRGRAAARGMGRRRPRRRPPAGGGAHAGHRAGRGRVRRQAGQRVHRVVDLAHALFVPAQRVRRDRPRLHRTSPSAGHRSSTTFEREGVRFGLEVHPTEIAYDFVTTRRTLEAIGHREGFGINFDPSHFAHAVPGSGGVRRGVRAAHLPRARQGLAQDARRAPVDPRSVTSTSASSSVAGISCRPVTATSTSSRCCGR